MSYPLLSTFINQLSINLPSTISKTFYPVYNIHYLLF